MTRADYILRNDTIVQLAQEGKTADFISKAVNLSKNNVLQILKSKKIKAAKPYRKLHSELAVKVVEELKAGTKQIEIAKKIGVSRQYVNQVKQTLENVDKH